MLLISAFPVRIAFLPLLVIFEYCHPHPLFVLSTVPSCKDIQIPHDFRVEINDVSTRLFLKQTLSHSSSVLKLTFIDGPPWQNNFGDGALNQYKGVSSRDKSVSSRYKSVFTRTPVLDSFGCFLMSESQSNGTKGCNSRAHNPSKPCQSTVFPIDQLWHHCHLQQICWFPSILAILDHLEQERFWEAATFFYSNDQNKCCFRQKPKTRKA